MLFNLLPIPPLDGSHILRSFSPAFGRLEQSEHGSKIALGAFVIVFFFGAEYLFGIAFSTATVAIDQIHAFLP